MLRSLLAGAIRCRACRKNEYWLPTTCRSQDRKNCETPWWNLSLLQYRIEKTRLANTLEFFCQRRLYDSFSAHLFHQRFAHLACKHDNTFSVSHFIAPFSLLPYFLLCHILTIPDQFHCPHLLEWPQYKQIIVICRPILQNPSSLFDPSLPDVISCECSYSNKTNDRKYIVTHLQSRRFSNLTCISETT